MYGQVGFTYSEDSNDKPEDKKVDSGTEDADDVFELIPQLDIPVNTVLVSEIKPNQEIKYH